jgi:Na+-translocating ferredoxin:NAD+ oxidoreductase RnfG subunit
MGEKSYGKLVVEELVGAITRAIVYSIALLVVTNIILGTLRQEAKEAIQYAAQNAPGEAINTILSDPAFNKDILPKIKQNTKEAIEYTVNAASRKLVVSAEGKSKK